jgi:hypothetical protein
MPRFVVGCPVLLFAATDVLSRPRWRGATLPALLALCVAANLPLLAGWLHAYMSMI